MSDYEELLGRLHDAANGPPFWSGEDRDRSPSKVSMRHAQIMALEQAWPLILEALKAKDEEHDGKLSDVPDLMLATMPMAFLECPHCGGELFTLAQLKVYVGDGSDLPDDAPSQPSSSDSGNSLKGQQATPSSPESSGRLPSRKQP